MNLHNELEAIIDREGLGNVLRAVEHICAMKAEDAHNNWRDVEASQWNRAGRYVSTAQTKAEEMGL